MNDQLIALIRTVYQGAIAAIGVWLIDRGIEIDTAALEVALWPVILGVYYFAAQQITARVSSTTLSFALTGPGQAPSYTEPATYEEAIAMAKGDDS